jgi:hypothetical protein
MGLFGRAIAVNRGLTNIIATVINSSLANLLATWAGRLAAIGDRLGLGCLHGWRNCPTDTRRSSARVHGDGCTLIMKGAGNNAGFSQLWVRGSIT